MDTSITLQVGKLYRHENCYGDHLYFFLTGISGAFIYYYNLATPDIIEYDMKMWGEDTWEEVC